MNYTNDQTDYMVEQYKNKPSRITVDRLAKELNKSPKSIIGKLSREGVYRRSVYKTKTGETPVTKIELVSEIAGAFEICLLYTSPSPRDVEESRMPSSA